MRCPRSCPVAVARPPGVHGAPPVEPFVLREATAFKLLSADVPAMPQPSPEFEIFVYSPEMEGIHLRGGRIARGGIRWSDRMDYRTEVYGLMRAQLTKNAIIVPAGAKGGFFLRRVPASRPELVALHHAKLYGHAEPGAPSISVQARRNRSR